MSLVFNCFFTKWIEYIPIPDKATTIAKQLYIVFTRYGCPDVIISDRGIEFCNQLNEALFYYMGVETQSYSSIPVQKPMVSSFKISFYDVWFF